MKKLTLSFLAAAIALPPLPAFAQQAQPSSQKNTNEAAVVVAANSIHQNTNKFDFNEHGVAATTEIQASDLRWGALAPAVRDVATDRATALDRHVHKGELLIAAYNGDDSHRGGRGRGGRGGRR